MELQTRKESWVLTAAGGGLMALAAFFLWRDLDLPRELVLLGAMAGAGLVTALGRPRRWPAAGPAALIATTVIAGLWYVAERRAGLLPSLAVGLVAAAGAVVNRERRVEGGQTLVDRLSWYAFGAALLGTTWSFYFHFLTAGAAADSVGRRLIPTITWLALGLALFIAGKLRARFAVHVGLALTGLAVVKATFYDTTHLHGGLRVAVLAAAGGLLLFAARVLRRAPALPSAPGAEVRS